MFVSVEALAQASAGAPQAAKKTFATPKQAVDALIQAAESYDLASLQEILGPESKNILSSEDKIFLDSRSEEHTSELQSRQYLVCRLLLEKKQAGQGPAVRACVCRVDV